MRRLHASSLSALLVAFSALFWVHYTFLHTHFFFFFHLLRCKASHASILLAFLALFFVHNLHFFLLHSFVFVGLPSQSAPPFAGAGFVQKRVFVLLPPPHFTEHSLYALQSDQPPLM